MSDKFVEYGGKRFPLDAGMTLEQAKDVMARHFPELAEPKVETKKEGEVTVYVFTKQAGRKGRGRKPRATPLQRALANLLALKPCAPQPDLVRLCVTGELGDTASDVVSYQTFQSLARDFELQSAQARQIAAALLDLPTTRVASGSIL